MSVKTEIKKGEIRFVLNLREHPLERIRYAAYAMTGKTYAFLEEAGVGHVRLRLRPKAPLGARDLKGLSREVLDGLELEKLRFGILSNNREIKEHIIGLAISGEDLEERPSGALTEEQKKELKRLIAEVEEEIRKGSLDSSASKDPLGVTQTWEQRYGGKRTER